MTSVRATAPSGAPTRVLALDWFDGARSGLAEYDGSGNVCQFQLVSIETSEPWVFTLRKSPLANLSELDEVLKSLGNARLPVWVPIWRFDSDSEKDRAEAAVSAAMPSSSPVIAIVIARRIEDMPVVVRTVATEDERLAIERMEREVAGVSEWMRFCGVPAVSNE
jgi:hypothetical protein